MSSTRRAALAMTLTASVLVGCGLDPQYGATPIAVGATTVYFIREVRGNNYDSLVISTSSDVCQELDSSTNYVFTELGPTEPYYRIETGVLHLYGTRAAEPAKTFPVTIVQHVLSPLEFRDLQADAKRLGLTKVVVPTTPRRKC